MKKRCAECEKTKPVSQFHRKRRGVKTTFNSYCKPCSRKRKNEWYAKNKEGAAKQRLRSREAKQRLRDEVTALRQNPCLDCSQTYHPWQMEFDHINPANKVASVSYLVSHSNRKAIFEEIEKCELVCANCHAHRTYLRAQDK